MSISTALALALALALDLIVRRHWRGGDLVLKGVEKAGEREWEKERSCLLRRGVGFR